MAANDEEEDPPVITAVDYLRQLHQLEQEAKETYPARIDSCSFRLGYVTQPVYSCLSENCRVNGSPAGFCYACSVSCHTDHKVMELFTKRHFRCDCGTQKSPNTPCCLISGPEDERKLTAFVVNEENVYNHNFDGRYCWCDRVYDPYSEEGTMFQCVLCYDWRHEKCIGLVPPERAFVEYICRTCVSETKFLKRYRGTRFIAGISKTDGVAERFEGYDDKQGSSTTATLKKLLFVEEKEAEPSEKSANATIHQESSEQESTDVRAAEVKKSEIHAMQNAICKDLEKTTSLSKSSAMTLSAIPSRLRTLAPGFSPHNPSHRSGSPATPTTGGRVKRLAAEDIRNADSFTPSKRSRFSSAGFTGCRLADMPEVRDEENVDLFCKDGWREDLCRCSTCMSEYQHTMHVLTEEEEEYEPELDEDDDEDPSIFERGMKALGSMPRTTQVDGAMAYCKMRDEIKGFLSGFASSGEIVKKEDVLKFFEEKKVAHLKERNTQPGVFF